MTNGGKWSSHGRDLGEIIFLGILGTNSRRAAQTTSDVNLDVGVSTKLELATSWQHNIVRTAQPPISRLTSTPHMLEI